ncbi:MAG: polymer-forming cytoskeletal protein [Myxococcota bacterium]
MAARQHAPSAPTGDGITIIGEGIHVNGRITGEEDLRVEGRVEGAISLTETVHVARSGVVVATIEARDVVVDGVVVGNVSATNSVSLEPGAKLVGDISAPRLIIADGAAFRGNVAMTEGGESAARNRAAGGRSKSATRARPASGASRAASTPSARATPRATAASRKAERSVTPRVAAIRPPKGAQNVDEEVTVVVRHAALSESEQSEASSDKAAKKKAKKAPPRGRVPKRGKRSVNRR